jgi:hypothetical protein
MTPTPRRGDGGPSRSTSGPACPMSGTSMRPRPCRRPGAGADGRLHRGHAHETLRRALLRPRPDQHRPRPRPPRSPPISRDAPEADRLWCIALLSGRRPRRMITTTKLREWAAERAGIPLWLFEACYPVVGDLSETIALVLPEPRATPTCRSPTGSPASARSTRKTRTRARPPSSTPGTASAHRTLRLQQAADGRLAHGRQPEAHDPRAGPGHRHRRGRTDPPPDGRLDPDTVTWASLIEAPDPTADLSRPYPFYLAYQIDGGARDAGPRHRLAGGAQMGRHPRPADPAGRRTLALVAGRGADHRPLPRTGPAARFPAPRHRHRRRGPGL